LSRSGLAGAIGHPSTVSRKGEALAPESFCEATREGAKHPPPANRDRVIAKA
jgi:hypothetical protein